MVEPQSSRFWQAAIRSGLLDEAALQRSWDAIAPEKRTLDAVDRRLARQMVNAGQLTLWQAQQLLAGRWQGLKIDRYELQDILGHGGMGRVYLARDAKLGRKVALKILSRERMNNPRALTRFRREAKVGAQLQHENLVRIYDEGEAHGVRYLVMEYIEGKTVGKLIAELGRLPPATAASLGRQVALGLEHLHVKGLLHRDVNPMNILVDHDGTAKLTDLGLAIDLGDLDDVVTRDGATVGTFDYISPEQARHSRSVGPGADLYSLGCTIYHMIAGRVPFPSPSLPEKLYAHQLSEAEPLGVLVPGTPDGLAAVVVKLMRKTAEERYPRACDAARALESFTSGSLSPDEISAVTPLSQSMADAPSGATHDGSDPDLQLKPSTPTTPPSEPSEFAPQFDFLPKIDFGPEPPLSANRGGRSAVKPLKPKSEVDVQAVADRPRKPFPTRSVAIGVGSLAAFAVVVGLVVFLMTRPARPRKAPTGNPTNVQANEGSATPANARAAEIAIRYPDGTEAPQEDLRQAITRLAGRGGEIVLRTKKSLQVGDLKTALKLADGHLVIRAADGARPDLTIVLSDNVPWIEVAPRAKLTLIGLSVHVTKMVAADAKAAATPVPPSVIASNGKVALDRCWFSISGDDRSTRLLSAEGEEARATGCVFEGFDRPIALVMYPGSEGRFSQCLFVRNVINPLSGWAITATVLSTPDSRPRKLLIDRCTVLGAGLLAADGFAADSPLMVTATNNAVRTSAVLLTGISARVLPKAIAWTAKDNAYALNGAAWIVVPPTGFTGLKDGPADLKSWAELMKGDTNGRDEAMKFAGTSITEGHPPEDYAVIIEKGQPPAGADPTKVGP